MIFEGYIILEQEVQRTSIGHYESAASAQTRFLGLFSDESAARATFEQIASEKGLSMTTPTEGGILAQAEGTQWHKMWLVYAMEGRTDLPLGGFSF